MLSPNQRELYLSALRPPPGFRLDRAIGTTYSLDLITLLSLPLSFALLDMTNDEGKLVRDPVALLHALRTYASRLTIFCQAGGIAVPAQRHPLYAHLEDAIVPVRKDGGAFHPKIWVLRFTSPGEPVRYRFLCLSRNITGDPSWDTLLALDGEIADRQRAFAKNHPLADFLLALPSLAGDQPDQRHRQAVALLSDELRRVRFDVPEPFADYEFYPMGLPGFRAPEFPDGSRRFLVLSPFLSPPFLKEIADEVPTILISRAESLDAIDAATLKKFEQVFAIIESASGDDEAVDAAVAPAPLASLSDDPATQAWRGLHAKLYLADAGWDSDLWTGSANATSAGFYHNVEFLTRLTGKKSKVGIEAFLNGVSGSKGFSQFLSPYQIPKSPPVVNSVVQQNAEAAEELRSMIAALPLRLEITPDEKLYRLTLRTHAAAPAKPNVTAVAWPITLAESAALPFAPVFAGKDVSFEGLSSQALTAFIAVRIRAGRGQDSAQLRFVLKLPLSGAPQDRFENLLHHVLSDPANVLRYLLFLIHHDGLSSGSITDIFAPGKDLAKRHGANGAGSIPLFEELSRALATQPELLDGVQSLVDDLRKTEEGAALLPPNFEFCMEADLERAGGVATMSTQLKPDAEEVCRALRDFQRSTVDYAYRRLYLDPDRVDRFLVADEVGLGKTWVAKGVIAQAVAHLWDTKKRIDVLYICSNAEIARQNINRLNLGESKDQAFASRLTLLPLQLRDLNKRKVNFISFTPGTSLDFGTSSGARRERGVLYWLLADIWAMRGTAAMNLLQANAGIESWRTLLDEVKSEIDEQGGFEPAVVQRFKEALIADPSLAADFEEQSQFFGRARKRLVPYEQRHARNQLIARLRRALARSCLAVFEPDLIILDEFQRFRNLLQAGDDKDEAAQLAQQLFQSAGAKILLLSATPYKMYTVSGEIDGDDHYRDFLETSRFLLANDPEDVNQLEQGLVTYRRALCGQDIGVPLESALHAVEQCLRKVMCRTERLAATADRNGMLKEVQTPLVPIVPEDFLEYRLLSKLARQVEADDPIELWKSSPYLINIMEDTYRLKTQLHAAIENQNQPVLAALRQLMPWQVPGKAMERYQPIDPKNPRLRTLIDDLAQSELWKLLWLPPNIPYYVARGAFAGTEDNPHTKQLIFSSWRVVPRSIAMLVSYAMERLMVLEGDPEPSYAELRESHGPLLRWSEEDGRLGGMPLLALFYPCVTLAKRIDPLAQAQAQRERLTRAELESRVAKEVTELLSPLVRGYDDKSARPDQRWYWAAPLLLDQAHAASVRHWMTEESDDWSWGSPDDEEQSLFQKHVAEAAEILDRPKRLGRPPDDLAEVLTKISLGAPGTVLLRSLLRHSPPSHDHAAWQSAASAAFGFRTLFNAPESMLLLRGLFGRQMPYWDQVLSYCCDGNLQAVIDEYVHILLDLLGVQPNSTEGLRNLGDAIGEAVGLRTSSLAYDMYRPTSEGGFSVRSQRVRCRFAQRFGESDSEDGSEKTREGALRDAFNSPFRPFILASTSIGQEGLDFHPYCHALVHWNLPTNPVDLEQREGRVHRFKGHFIRKNLARAYGIEGTKGARDPWAAIFDTALDRRPAAQNDMVPFWIFEGPSKIERRLPMLPLSREETRFDDLKQSLALYRMTFGQPRQQELLEYLKRHAAEGITAAAFERHIDLRPPSAS